MRTSFAQAGYINDTFSNKTVSITSTVDRVVIKNFYKINNQQFDNSH